MEAPQSNGHESVKRGEPPSQTSPSMPELPNLLQEEPIPHLQNISPAIFVQLEESLLKRFDAPRDKIERLKLILERIGIYSDNVRRNLLFLFTREKDRIIQDIRNYEATLDGQEQHEGITLEEADAMIHNMSGPAVEGRDYTLVNPIPSAPPSTEWATTKKAQAFDELFRLIEYAVFNLNGFNAMIAKVNNVYHQAMDKEKSADGQVHGNTESAGR